MPIAPNALPCIYPTWSAPRHIKALTTTRQGGVSQSTHYTSLNLAMHAADQAELVQENRRRLSQHIGHPIQWLSQNHTSTAVQIDTYHSSTPADAAYTNTPGTVCAVLTADCVPIILTDKAGTFVAAIHAGWKGLAQNIISHTVDACRSTHMIAWIGPCISPLAYTVGPEFLDHFLQQYSGLDDCFTCDSQQQWRADLPQISTCLLQQAGVEVITAANLCTYDPQNQLFSARRDGIQSGRIATCIWMEK
jgi:YfiH family protein